MQGAPESGRVVHFALPNRPAPVAKSLDELRRFINGRILVQVWPELNLPKGVRRAWGERYPQLRSAA